MDEDKDVFEVALHPVRVCYKIWGRVAPVKLHSLYNVEGGYHALCLFNGYYAVFADFVHRLCDQFSD